MNENHELLDALTREGVLLNVTVRYWRATKKLRPEDLGLDPDQVTDRLISLGHKKLLPKDALGRFAVIESRAHALVEAGTFPFLRGLSHFLPNAKLDEVTGRLTELEQEFQVATREFLDRYATVRSEAMAEWTGAAQRLAREPERLLATIEASFPDVTRMGRYFEFSMQMFQIRAPEDVDLQLVMFAEQREVIAARQRAATEAAIRIRAGAEQFVGDCVASLRQQTAELCGEMLDSMRNGKTGVHQRTLNRLVQFIDEFRKLNFVGDHQMEAALNRVRQEFLGRTAEEYRDDTLAKQRLEAGLHGLAATARELATQDARELVERFGNLGQRRLRLAA